MERFFSNILKKGGTKTALLEITRPWNALVTGLLALFGATVIGGVDPVSGLLVFLIFTFAYMAGTTVNDIYDELIDKINMPYRPLQEKRVSRSGVWKLSIFLHALTLVIGFTLGWKIFLLTIVFFIFSFIYSVPPVALNKRGILGQIELSITVLFIPVFTGMVLALGNFFVPINYILVMLFFSSLFVFIFLLKDFKDIQGDRAWNKKTPVAQLGPKNTKTLSIIGSVISFIMIMFFFYRIFEFSIIQVVILIFVLGGIIYVENLVTKNPEKSFGLARLMLLAFLLVLFGSPLGIF